MGRQMFSKFFNSIAEFIDYADKKPKEFKFDRNKEQWQTLEDARGGFHGSWDTVKKRFRNHDVNKEASLTAGIMSEINCADFSEARWEFKQRMEEGDIIDIGRYLDGQEKFWCGVKRCMATKRVVRVYMGFGGCCGRDADELAVCGAAAVTLTEILESLGIGVELWGVAPSTGLFTDNDHGQVVIKLKDSDEFSDLGMINFICGNDAVFRNGVFRAWVKLAEEEGKKLDYGLGYSREPKLDEIGLCEEEKQCALVMPKMYEVSEARSWLIDLINNKIKFLTGERKEDAKDEATGGGSR